MCLLLSISSPNWWTINPCASLVGVGYVTCEDYRMWVLSYYVIAGIMLLLALGISHFMFQGSMFSSIFECKFLLNMITDQGEGTQIIFDGVCGLRSETPSPLPISKDFCFSKNGWFDSFFESLANWDPFLRGFLPHKWLILHFFFGYFCEMGSYKDVCDENGNHVLRIFGEK